MLNFLKNIATLITIFLISILNSNLKAQEPARILSLDEAIAIAVENNHSVELAKLDTDISKARVRKAKSGFYPQIEGKIVLPFVERESGFFLEQLIWDFGRTLNRIKSTKFELEASKYAYNQTLNDTIQHTAISYYKALINKSCLEAAEKNLEKNELILEKIKEQNKLGRSSNLDLTRAKSDTGNSRLELLRKRNEYETSKLQLLDIIGVEFDSDVKLLDEKDVYFKDYELKKSLEKAVNNNLELKKLGAKQLARLANVKAVRSEFYPQIFGRTAYRFEGEGGEDDPSLIAGFGLRIPIFEGFSRFAKLDIKKAENTRLLIQFGRAKKRIQSDVKKLFMNLRFNEEKIEVAKINNGVALNNLNLLKEKFKLGRASKIELVDAELFYSESHSNYLESIYNYKITEAKFKAAIGEY